MRLLVCGGRDLVDSPEVYAALASYMLPGTVVIHGGAPGADSIAGEFAKGLGLTVEVYPADWHKHGRAAGPIRNQRMINEAKPDLVLALPGGRGTADMVRRAKKAGIPIVSVA